MCCKWYYAQLMGSRARIAAVAVFTALGLLLNAPAASAKIGAPFRVVTPGGSVFWVRGAAARAWWHGIVHAPPGSCSCTSPAVAARYTDGMMARLGSGANRYYVVISAGDVVPMIVYPATSTTPAYVVQPNVLGTARLTWNYVTIATPQMMRILTSGSTPAADRAALPANTPGGGMSWVWVAAVLCVTLAAGGAAVVTRRSRNLPAGAPGLRP